MSSSNQSQDRSLSSQAIQSVEQYLSQFAATDDFEAKIETAFGTKIGAAAIRQQWLSGDFSLIPEIKVLSNGELGTANGAYAASLDEIFVSSDFLAQHQGDVAAVSELLLEEIGHKIDTVLNGNVDSPGDEGAIFRLLATGQGLSAENLARLRTQDDHAVIMVDRLSVVVENQSFSGTNGNDIFNPGTGSHSIDGGAGLDYLSITNSTDTVATTISYTTPTNGKITGGSNDGTTFQNIESVNFTTGSGDDNINVSAATSFDPSFGRPLYTGDIRINAGKGNNTIVASLTGIGTYLGGTGNDTMTAGNSSGNNFSGGGGNDTFIGSIGNNNFSGGGGNDTFIGGAGDETFNPGTGADSIDGGVGNDRLSIGEDINGYSTNYNNVATTINYTTLTNGVITGGANSGTTFKNIENLNIATGSGNDDINISAASGTNIIRSNGGNDILIGGTGNDGFSLGSAGGSVSIDGGTGTNSLSIADDNNTSATNINYTSLTNGTITGGIRNGSTFKNIQSFSIYFGYASQNYVNISAATGDSEIKDGTGNATLIGGSGNDKFSISRGGDSIDGGAGNDFLGGNSYTTTSAININYTTLTNGKITGGSQDGTTFKNIEKISYSTGSGNDTINISAASGGSEIYSYAGDDTLIGGGADKLYGGYGNDTYIVSRTLGGGTVIDDLHYSGTGDVLSTTNDTLTLTGGASLTTNDISRSGTTLLIDLNQDGIFDPTKDLSIDNYFANTTGSVAGNGFIENVDNLSGSTVLNLYTSTRNDFNSDGKSDILWQSTAGTVALWQMSGATVTAANLTSTPTLDPSWKAAGTGDFNGDGKADILWRNTNGAIAVWAMDGATVKSSTKTSTPSLDTSWTTAGTGDYNGDGKADILWRNNDGAIVVWAMDGATIKSSTATSTPSLDSSWKVAGNSDFNGDGKSDILWRNDDGSVALWQMNGAAITSSTAIAKLSTDWKIAGTGDFNGDNKADILWRNDDGRVVLWQMNGAAITSSSLTSTPSRDSSQTVAGIADYNGDGKADILWRKDTGALEVWQMNGSTVVSSTLTSVAAESSNWKIAAPII